MKKVVNPGWSIYSIVGIIIFIACLAVGVVVPVAGGEPLNGLRMMIIVEMTIFLLLAAYLLMVFSRSYAIEADGLTIWYFGVLKKHYTWKALQVIDIYKERNGCKYIRCLPEKSDIPASRYGFRHPLQGICFKHNGEDARKLTQYAGRFSYYQKHQ